MPKLIHHGVRLNYRVTGDDRAPAVLLLHGLAGSLETWDETVNRLSDRYHVWRFDFRGHGESDRVPEGYLIDDYVSDAVCLLETIGKPTMLVGHSLGGVTAAHLAAGGHRLVTRVFLEDPPLFIDDPGVWESTIYATIFPRLRDTARQLQQSGASYSEYEQVATNAPAPGGRTAGQAFSPAQLAAGARAMMQQDPRTWDPAIDQSVFASMDARLPISCPVTIIRADPNCGSAFMPDDDKKLAATPHVQVVMYEGAGHRIHHDVAQSERFLGDVEEFLAAP